MVEPHHSYRVSILNLPEPEDEPESLRMNITIPGEIPEICMRKTEKTFIMS